MKSLYGLTIFAGAYLLFQVEPLVGKIVTTTFGGASAIWCVCLLFFQIALLAGYVLTFAISRTAVKTQCLLYEFLMVGSIALLRLPAPQEWLGTNSGNPAIDLILLLATYVGLPCVLLSTVSGMMQNWFNLSKLGDPYPLYALSNLGSLGALILYPLVVEPNLTVSRTLSIWSQAYVGLCILSCLCAAVTFKRAASEIKTEEHADKLNIRQLGYWLTLSAMGSVVLLVYTTYLTQDIAPVPLLWVLPLSIYLLTFILSFANIGQRLRLIYLYGAPVLWMVHGYLRSNHLADGICLLAIIFFACMCVHGEIVRSKPDPQKLPAFYLAIALGGAIGGVFVNFAAPLIFDFYFERILLVVFLIGLCFYLSFRKEGALFHNALTNSLFIALIGSLCLMTDYEYLLPEKDVVYRARNFYGCAVVRKTAEELILGNGAIIHGSQWLDPARKGEATRYYTKNGPLGLIEAEARKAANGQPMRIGIVGLGAGTIATYGHPEDVLTFYEIDPKIVAIAKKNFTYLANCPAHLNIIQGDARISLAGQEPQNYDLMVIDAFNSDAIPLHLLTRECAAIYLKHLKPNGILALHVSNRYLDIEPVIGNLAASLKLYALTVEDRNIRYVAFSREPIDLPAMKETNEDWLGLTIRPTRTDNGAVWTDDYSDLFPALRRRL